MPDPKCKNCGDSLWLHPELDFNGLVGGQNVAEYVANSPISKAIPSPIVIVTREEFFRLCCDYDKRKRNAILQDALDNGLILAA